MTSLQINLIDGDFSAENAREILIDLINKKIQFHSLKSHEKWEKSGTIDLNGQKRIKELEQARANILELTNTIASNETRFTIHSFIHITEN